MTTNATRRPSGEIRGSLTKRMRVRSCGTIARGMGMGRMIRQRPRLDKRRGRAVSSGRYGARRSDPHRALNRGGSPCGSSPRHLSQSCSRSRWPPRSSPRQPAALEAGPARRHGQLAAGADRPAARAQGARRDPRRQDQAAARLQGGAVGARDQQRARHDLGRQGHAVRLQPRGRQRLRGRGQGRPARGQDRSPRASTCPTAWPSRTARSTSRRSRRITKMVGIEDKLDSPPAMEVVYDILPRTLPHGWKYLAFGPDGKLYFNIGAPCNICIPPDTHANISRVNPDGTGFEYCGPRRAQQRGLRLAPGDEGALLRHPRAATGSARTCRATASTWRRRRACTSASPTATRATSSIPSSARGARAREFAPPLHQDGPARGRQRRRVLHRARCSRAEYKNRAFLAQRGSWNRTQKIGFRVMMVTLRAGDVPKYEVVRRGLARRATSVWGRPVYTQADEGRLAPDRRRLRGRDLPRHLPAADGAGLAPPSPALSAAAAPLVGDGAGGGRRRRRRSRGRPAQGRAVRGLPRAATATRRSPARRRSPASRSFFTHWQLIKYRDGRRKDPQMSPLRRRT